MVDELEKELIQSDNIPTKTLKWRIPKIPLMCRVLIYLGTIIFSVCSILELILKCFSSVIAIIIYVCAAVCLFIACFYIIRDIQYLSKNVIKPRVAANPFTNKVSTDYRYRTIMFTLPGFGLNVVFAVFNGVVAIVSKSGWYGSLAAYYLLLGVMRSGAIGYVRSSSQQESQNTRAGRELKVYRRCGFLLLLMSFALGGSVFLMVREGNGKTYPGILIYAVAAYTFWKIARAIVNVIKARKTKSPLLMILRNIGYTDAFVSLLSLQTAMFAEFSEGENNYVQPINAATGIVVCLMILVMGVYIIHNSYKMKINELGGMENDTYSCS